MQTSAEDKRYKPTASDKPMTQKRRKILKSKRRDLVTDMDVRQILLQAAEFEVFTDMDEDIIKSKQTKHEQREALLDILPSRGDNAYTCFIVALARVQPFLAQLLIRAENEELGKLDHELAKECPRCQDFRARVETKLKARKERITQLKEENKKLSNQLNECTEKLEQVKEQYDQLKKEKIVTESEMAKISAEVEDLQSKNKLPEDEVSEGVHFVNCVLLSPCGMDFQSSGVISALSRNSSAKVIATRSSDGEGKASDILCHRNNTTCSTEGKQDSWMRIDLGEKYLLFITHCAFKYRRNDPRLRKWQLQGSTDCRQWTVLKTERKQLANTSLTTTWSVEGKGAVFRYFQIMQTGTNESGKYGIFLSGLELYGVLLEVRRGKNASSKIS